MMVEKRTNTRPRPAIEVVSGADAGARFPIGFTMLTVGRDEGMDITVVDELAADAHAGFILWKGQVRVFDFGSDAGTFVNGERVVETSLEEDDEIQIGGTRFRFVGNA